jgi:hypothetical protein
MHPLATRMIVLFATEPQMRITVKEVARKYAWDERNVGKSLRLAVQYGWIAKHKRAAPVGQATVEYGAGPALLQEL